MEPDEFSAIDAVIARAVADAYDKGRALGYAEGYDAGFLVMAKAAVGKADDSAKEQSSRIYEDADGNTRCRRCLSYVEGGYCGCVTL